MMKNANSLLMDLEEQMNMIGLPLMVNVKSSAPCYENAAYLRRLL